MRHIAVKKSNRGASFARSQFDYWFQSYKLVELGAVY